MTVQRANKPPTDEELKKKLTFEQYDVLRKKATEPPFSGKLLHNTEKGMYVCAACGNELFSSDAKFDSECGWPAFYEAAAKGKVKTKMDLSNFMVRTEVTCGSCGSHLGHVFIEPTRTGKRYCINSLALDFKKAKGDDKGKSKG